MSGLIEAGYEGKIVPVNRKADELLGLANYKSLDEYGDDVDLSIIAVGRYYFDTKTNRAEVAFVVGDRWQGRGIGKFLLGTLTRIAKRNGIRGFTAEVLAENKAMQAVFNRCGLKVSSGLHDRVYSYILDFE